MRGINVWMVDHGLSLALNKIQMYKDTDPHKEKELYYPPYASGKSSVGAVSYTHLDVYKRQVV